MNYIAYIIISIFIIFIIYFTMVLLPAPLHHTAKGPLRIETNNETAVKQIPPTKKQYDN